MQKKFKVLLTFGIIIVLIAFLYFFTNWFSLITGYLKGTDATSSLASCLNEKGAEFYSSTYCADCEKQLEIFGNARESIKYVDCGKEKELCQNVREIPAWYVNKKIYFGFKTIEQLKEL